MATYLGQRLTLRDDGTIRLVYGVSAAQYASWVNPVLIDGAPIAAAGAGARDALPPPLERAGSGPRSGPQPGLRGAVGAGWRDAPVLRRGARARDGAAEQAGIRVEGVNATSLSWLAQRVEGASGATGWSAQP